MTLSFRWRLTIRWVIAFGAILAFADLAIYIGARTFLRHDFEAQLRTLAATELASAVDDPRHTIHLHEFPSPSSPDDHADKFVQLIAADGRILLQSASLHGAAPFVQGAMLQDAFARRSPVLDVTFNDRRGRMIALVTDPPDPFVVAVGLFTGEFDATLRRLRDLLVAVWIAALGLTAVIGFTLASRALLPISRITERAGAIADGHFDARLDPPKVDDEIGQMTRLLNHMLDRLHGALEANRRFAADASHELRGPLTAMLGEIDVTLKRERTAPVYRESMVLLRDRLKVMAELTQDLMILVRAQENRPPAIVEVALRDLLTRIIEGQSETAAATHIQVHLAVTPDVVVYGDAVLLERLFENLVRNAIQYNVEHGSVEVAARLVPSGSEQQVDRVLITIRNSGAGIREEDRERVFERFYRVDPSRSRRTGGAGLGLALSREIVQLFKGEIRVAPPAGDGTTIEVSLPGAAATAVADA